MADSYIDVDAAIASAKKSMAEKNAATAKVGIVRNDLRNAVTMGATTPEQTKWIEEHFPARERVTDPTEQVAKAEQRLAEVREKAAKKGKNTVAKAA